MFSYTSQETGVQSVESNLYKVDYHGSFEKQIGHIERGEFDQLDRRTLVEELKMIWVLTCVHILLKNIF